MSSNPYKSPTGTKIPAAHGGWLFFSCTNVVLATVAMAATMPGRTHGLGIITEPLLADLKLGRTDYAHINLWATLLGALLCLPAGRLIDRYGTRWTATLVTALLGVVVIAMSQVQTASQLFIVVLATRALGQSALSVVSISIVAKWFGRRADVAMSIYSVLLAVMFGVAMKVLGGDVLQAGWRGAWNHLGLVLLVGAAPLFALLVRSPRVAADAEGEPADQLGYRLREALATPAFWIFGGSASLFGLVTSGMGLFNESILAERGFDATTYHNVLMLTSLIGLLGQLVCGALALQWSLHRLMAVAMVLYAVSLVMLPQINTLAGLYAYAVVLGVSGGMVTVLFFAIWGQVYGRAHVGMIQGAAQMLSVVSSAVGPLLFSTCYELLGTYTPLFYGLAPLVLLLGVAAALVPMPERQGERTEVAIAG